ncbi:hypothetical protein H0H93_014767, partial [Arthromyces matolae]
MAKYQSVWAETIRVYYEMCKDEGWTTQNTVDIPAVNELPTKMALLVIAKCGFGLTYNWSSPPTGPDGTITVQEALRVLVDSFIISLIIPEWMRNLPLPGFAEVRRASKAFSEFMKNQVTVRTAEVKSGSVAAEERSDAFTMLVRANEQETGKLKLSDQELIGNVFILLFAGHETTAHTLSSTLALLALHQDIQEEILEQIISVVGHDRDP